MLFVFPKKNNNDILQLRVASSKATNFTKKFSGYANFSKSSGKGHKTKVCTYM